MKQIKSYPEKSPTTGESQVERSSQKAPSHLCRPTRHHSSTQTHPDSPACCLDQPAKSRQSSLPSRVPKPAWWGTGRENGPRGEHNQTVPSLDATSHLGGHDARGAARGEAGTCRGNNPEDSPKERPRPRPG